MIWKSYRRRLKNNLENSIKENFSKAQNLRLNWEVQQGWSVDLQKVQSEKWLSQQSKKWCLILMTRNNWNPQKGKRHQDLQSMKWGRSYREIWKSFIHQRMSLSTLKVRLISKRVVCLLFLQVGQIHNQVLRKK